MTREWRSVRKSHPCPACGKGDWCAWTREGWLKCERSTDAPSGYVLVTAKDGGALFRPDDGPAPTIRKAATAKPPTSKPARRATRAASPGPVLTYATSDAAVAAWESTLGKSQGTFTYHDQTGKPALLVVRFPAPAKTDAGPDAKPNKTFRPVGRVDGGWIKADPPGALPLYALPAIRKARPGSRVYVVEGEKTADAATSLHLLATTSAHGAQSADKSDWGPVRGLHVVILPDNDDDGDTYAADVVRLAMIAGAQSVRVVRLADHWTDLPHGGDLADLCKSSTDRDALRRQVEALADAATPEPEPDGVVRFLPTRAADLVAEYRNLRPVVVDGLLREGEVMNIVAAPKVGKSWLVHALALSVASGRPWVDCPTTKGAVLIVDGELHRETLAHRLAATKTTLGLADSTLDAVEVWTLRGRRATIDAIADGLRDLPRGTYRMIVLDALYRFLPQDGEENSNEDMTHVYNVLDAIGTTTGAAIAVVHHASKGDQSQKSVTDMGSGAGAQSRAADTHLTMVPHEEEGAVVVRAVARSFPPFDAFCIRGTNPGWVRASGLDPTKIRQPQRRSKTDKPKETAPALKSVEWTPEMFAAEVVGAKSMIAADVIAAGRKRDLSKAQAESLLKRAEVAGLVHRDVDRKSGRHLFTTSPAVLGGGEGPATPPPPGASAPGGMGGTRATPLPPLTVDGDDWGEPPGVMMGRAIGGG
jgi:hypothetical protein